MELFTKLPNSRREPPGLEWVIMKKLPMILLAGTLFPIIMSVGSRLFPGAGSAAEIARQVMMVDIMSIATLLTVWTAVFTVAIGCFVVMVMKGPAYVADAYYLQDADQPKGDRGVEF